VVEPPILNTCATKLLEVALKTGIPVGFGLLTTDDLDQAKQRSCIQKPSAPSQSNKGQEAADAVLEMIYLFRDL